MISYLYIKNFRNIKELELKPSQGVNLIIGNNGEGKSSILYAIEYMLTGNLNEKISNYIRWGEQEFVLRMMFNFNGNEYDLDITGGKTTEKVLVINEGIPDKVEIYKGSEATKKINTDLNAHLIKYSAISEQGKAAEIIFDTPANRLMRLKQILNIDKITDIVNEMKEEIKEKNNQLNIIGKEIELLENKSYKLLEEFELEDIEDLQKQFEFLEKDKQIYELELEKWNKYKFELQNYLDGNNKKVENEKLIARLEDEIKQKKSMKFRLDESFDEQKVRDEISLNEKFKIEQNSILRDTIKIQFDIDRYKLDIENQKEQLEKYQIRRLPSCDVTKENLDNLKNDLSNIKLEISQKEKEIILAKEGKCPTCGQNYIADVATLEEGLNGLKKYYKITKDYYETDQEKYDEYQEQLQHQEEIKLQRNTPLTLLKYSEEQLEKCKNDLNYQPEYKIIDFDSVIIKQKEELDSYLAVKKDIELIDKVCKDIEIKIASCKQLIEHYLEIKEPEEVKQPVMYNKERYDELNKLININEQKQKELERIKEYNLKIADQRFQDTLRIKDLTTEKDTLYYNIETLSQSQKLLDKDFSSFIIDKGSKFIKEQMNEFFQKAYDKYEITFSQDKHTIDFFYGDGENVAPIGMSSGFERALLGTAFRVALCSLNNIDIMSLDEIVSDSSVENSLALYETILNNISGVQFFIITHYEDTKEFLLQQPNSQLIEIENGLLKN